MSRWVKLCHLTSILFLFAAQEVLSQPALPTDSTSLFAGSGICQTCHESDGSIMMENGEDISPVTTWRSAMMAHSAKDPLWQAKVTAEVEDVPHLQAVIEDKCTTCHAPLGHTQAIHDGADAYPFNDMLNSPLALDGVSCTLCHQIQPDNLGTDDSYTGHYVIEEGKIVFGPYTEPLAAPMFNMSGFTPQYGEHVNGSELCATCHTLFTPYVDNEGNVAGTFPEQTPYLEWLNSDYPADNRECQSCHMPVADEAQDIAQMPFWHEVTREPFFKHDFAGANVYMVERLMDNQEELGITSSVDQLESTRDKNLAQLQQNSLNMQASSQQTDDSLFLDVSLSNLTGHKLPTGIPLRRMWVHLTAYDADEDVIFESGEWDDTGVILDEDEEYEPHYDIITLEDQVQIYEAVMQDVDEARTWTLLRAGSLAKDNRIPPVGFVDTHEDYEWMEVVGEALEDEDFNTDNGQQGSGLDIVHFHLPPATRVEIEVLYQTISPSFAAHLIDHESSEAATFESIYTATPNLPVRMADTSLTFEWERVDEDPTVIPATLSLHPCFPNPFNSSTLVTFDTPGDRFASLEVYSLDGRRVSTLYTGHPTAGRHELAWDANGLPSGVYFIHLQAGHVQQTQTVTLLK